MKIYEEEVVVYGTLKTLFGKYNLLSPYPTNHAIPFYLRDMNVLSFYVEDNDGFAKNILVRGDFLISPILNRPTTVVRFLIEEEDNENIKVESLDK